ncbi:MAG: flagellar biosynthetic protein FliR [Buchnera aphidicola (Eriosoma harunire)]
MYLLHVFHNIFFPLMRILSVFWMVPIFSERVIGIKIKILLSMLISFIIYPFIPNSSIDLFSLDSLMIIIHQIIIGLVLGFVIQIVFTSINIAGEIVSTQIGLSFANFFDHLHSANVFIISRLFNVITLFVFLTLNGHLWIIWMIYISFQFIPISVYIFNFNLFLVIVKFASYLFFMSFKLSFPVILLLLSLTCIMSFLNRVSPQISIFSIGFSVVLIVGLCLIYLLIPILIPVLQHICMDMQYFSFFNGEE